MLSRRDSSWHLSGTSSAPGRVGELAEIVATLPLPVIFKGGAEFADAAAAAGVYALDREINAQ